MLTKPSALIWYVTTIYHNESHFFTILEIGEGGGRNSKFQFFFQNRSSLYQEIQVVFKFGEDWMNIALILFVYVILSSNVTLKIYFWPKRGSKFKISKKSKNITSRHFWNTCCLRIWSHSDENSGLYVLWGTNTNEGHLISYIGN